MFLSQVGFAVRAERRALVEEVADVDAVFADAFHRLIVVLRHAQRRPRRLPRRPREFARHAEIVPHLALPARALARHAEVVRTLRRDQPHAVDEEFVLLRLAAEDRMVLEHEAASSTPPVLLAKKYAAVSPVMPPPTTTRSNDLAGVGRLRRLPYAPSRILCAASMTGFVLPFDVA